MPGNNELENAKGAYVNAIVLADGIDSYRIKVKEELSMLSFYVVEMEDIELFSDRKNKYSISEELNEIAENAENTGNVSFGIFHSYEEDEESN